MKLPTLHIAPSATIKDSPFPVVVCTLLAAAALFGSLRWLGTPESGDTTITSSKNIGDVILLKTTQQDGIDLTRISTREGSYTVQGSLSAIKGETMTMVHRKDGSKSICNTQNNCANLHSYARQTY